MGYYINKINDQRLPDKGKADFILKNIPGSKTISEPDVFKDDIVCVVYNRHFDAAGYAYDSDEMNAFKYPDGRNKTWMIVPNAKKYAE